MGSLQLCQIGGNELLSGFKGVNWMLGFQHEREQRDTWTPFCMSVSLGCEGCGEDGCH